MENYLSLVKITEIMHPYDSILMDYCRIAQVDENIIQPYNPGQKFKHALRQANRSLELALIKRKRLPTLVYAYHIAELLNKQE